MLILVRQKDLEDEKLFASIERENPTIKQEVKAFIDNNGMVFGRKKSRSAKGRNVRFPCI